MRLVESSEAASEAERAALSEMRRQLHEWENARRQLRSEPAAAPPPAAAPQPDLTYSRGDARAKVRARRRRAPAPRHRRRRRPRPRARAPAQPTARTRSRGTVHINLWTLDERGGGAGDGAAGARRRPLRNGTLDAWLANAPSRSHKDNDNK
ncbi:hypothetical protein HF086_016681 [Spodoptera exigua]|uniref:Uncharacterized protein n=1 Tax=Spodoptera exigua TaxID=7107 RepID=A0A922MV26_SPOEX|nr:hypothetical protein HF086_016681 [Spodoptera exigua]